MEAENSVSDDDQGLRLAWDALKALSRESLLQTTAMFAIVYVKPDSATTPMANTSEDLVVYHDPADFDCNSSWDKI